MRLDRFEALVGPEKLKLLRTRTVIVCGLGGVGSYAAEALARSGFGTLVLADFDVVDETNLNRQLIALSSTVGKPKADVMAARVADIDPAVRVVRFTTKLTPENIGALFREKPDYVVDAIDDVAAKVALIAACVERNVPVVSSMGFANKLHPELIRLTTLDKTAVDPLAKTVRQRLRQLGIAAPVAVVCSTEPPAIPRTEGVKLGSCAFVPSVAGLMLASHVVNQLLGKD